MKAVILNGSGANDLTGERINAALIAKLQIQGWDVEQVVLREQQIGACAGDFFCWIRTPGICNIDDDNRDIAAAIVDSQLVAYLSPVTFGGYSFTLKRMVDHQIQNYSPFFEMHEGETHHQKRYRTTPALLGVGWQDAPDTRSATIFRHLVQRNALNFHARTWISDVLPTSQADEELQAAVQSWLSMLRKGQSSAPVTLPAGAITLNGQQEIKRALLLVGSPKTRKSTSNSLGGYLFEHLAGLGVQTETIYLHTVVRSATKWQALLDALDAADLVMLAFPIYVDSLPAPVTEALERISTHRQVMSTRPQRFTAIANCGFPEANQCDTGLAICETFAREADFEWVGGLALGAGEMIYGASLVKAGGKAIRIRKGLELTATALAQEQAVPDEAREMLAKPVIPNWLYRFTGKMRWNRWAKDHGAQKLLKRQPYLTEAK
jgi:multimeric flavodoxin WrbA